MASLLVRSAANIVRRTALITSVRACGHHGPHINPDKGKVAEQNRSMPDTLGHSVGAERWEMLARLAGVEDPFEQEEREMGERGTFNEPNLITSDEPTRLIGCKCEEDALSVTYMTINRGELKRCMCGYYFKMVPVEYQDFGQ